MFDLPLFPLNSVLFPGMPLGLFIFEERYKEMMGRCLELGGAFGVVLIQEGREASGPLALPHKIGCTAKILRVYPREAGQMDVLALGGQRFKVRELKYDKPYLVGRVEDYPLFHDSSDLLAQTVHQLHGWVEQYLKIWEEVGEQKFEAWKLPQDPVSYAYMVAYLLQVEAHEKQPVLAAERPSAMLNILLRLYRREIVLMKSMLEEGAPDDSWPFSIN